MGPAAADGPSPGSGLFWDTSNQTTNFTWAHTNTFGTVGAGLLATNISTLDPATVYWYTFYATNSLTNGVWATPSTSFTTTGAPQGDGGVLYLLW